MTQDTESPTRPVVRGRRNPTSAWIVKEKGKRGTSYRIRWIDPGSGRGLSEACGRDFALARIARDKKREDLRNGITGKRTGKTLSDLIASVPTFMAGLSRATVGKTVASLKSLRDLCGECLLDQLGRDTVMEFRAKRLEASAATPTVNKDLRQIRSAISYAVDAKWIRTNPLLRWKQGTLKESDPIVRVVEPEEFDRVLGAVDDDVFRVLLIVAYHQGMRRTELANLRWAAVDLERGRLGVVNVPEEGELTKNRKNRTLPMHPTVRRELAALKAGVPVVIDGGKAVPKSPHVFTSADGRVFKPDWITRQFEAAANAAGVDATLHDLRRSFSTLAQRAGVDRVTVKDLGGWSSVKVVERHYTGEVAPAMQEAMRQIARSQGVA